jgi:hypothetical protein
MTPGGVRLAFVTSPHTSKVELETLYRNFSDDFASCDSLWCLAWTINEPSLSRHNVSNSLSVIGGSSTNMPIC